MVNPNRKTKAQLIEEVEELRGHIATLEASETERKRAEEEQRASLSQLHEIIEQSLDGIIITNENGEIIEWNRAVSQITGVGAEETLGETLWDMQFKRIPPERKTPEICQQLKAMILQMLKTGQSPWPERVLENELCRADGTRRWVESTFFAVNVNHQLGLASVVRDVTERKRAEVALRESEEKYRLLFENMQEGFALHEIITDENGKTIDFRFLDANAAYERHAGLKSQDCIGKTMLEIMPQADLRQIENYGQVALTGEPLAFEYFSKTFNRHLRVRAFCPQRGRFATIFEDITERKHMEEVLKESEDKYRQLFESGSDALFSIDAVSGEILEANAAAIMLYGYSREELLKLRNTDLSAEPDQTRKTMAEKHTLIPIRYHLKKDGTVFPVDITVSHVISHNRPVIIAAIRDITERKRAEEALRTSEERFRAISETVGDLIFTILPNGKVGYVNELAARAFHTTSQALIGRDPRDLFPPEIFERQWRGVQKVFETGESLSEESITRFAEGNAWVETHLTPLRDNNGHITAVLGDSRDITARKHAEKTLRESEARFREVMEYSLDAVYKRDLKTDAYDYMSPAITLISGYPLEEVLGMPIETVFSLTHPDDVRHVEQTIADAMSGPTGKDYQMDYRLKHKDGQYRWFQDKFTVLRDSQGQPVSRIGIVRDITEQKRVAEKLQARTNTLAAMQAIILDIASPQPLSDLLQLIVERAAKLIDVSSGGLYLCDPAREEVKCVVSYNTLQDITGTVLKYGEGAAGYVALTGRPLIIDDYRTWAGRAQVFDATQPFAAVLSLPLLWRDSVIGVVHVLCDDPTNPFTADDLELLSLFANHAAVAVEKSRLRHALEQELSERKRVEKRLEHLAMHDALTGAVQSRVL